MKHTEKELQQLKDNLSQMWDLVLLQLKKSAIAFLESNAELASEVIIKEKQVDKFELMVESAYENYIVLFSPVAIDLRLALSIVKISISLERIGDFAEGICDYVLKNKSKQDLLENLNFKKLFDAVIEMLSNCKKNFDNDKIEDAERMISQDDLVDDLYHNAISLLKSDCKNVTDAIDLALLLRKLERIGDHCNNIIEEIVFYVDAKVLKHQR